MVPTNVVSLPLKLVQPAIYATALDNDKYLVNTRMYLAVGAETSQAEIVGKTPQLVKVCSASHIEHLVRQALPGVPLTYVAVAAERDSRQVEPSVLQPEPVGPGMGSRAARPQPGRLCPGRSAEPAIGADHSAAAGGMMRESRV